MVQKAATVVQLYFEGVLPVDRRSPISIQIDNHNLGIFLLERVEYGGRPTSIDAH